VIYGTKIILLIKIYKIFLENYKFKEKQEKLTKKHIKLHFLCVFFDLT